MFDGILRKAIDPALNRAGRGLAAFGMRANQVTLVGLGFGVAAALLLALGAQGALALIPLLVNRICDGLDGAVARAQGKTGFGGFLDIVADFAFYGMIPFGFAVRDPAFALPAAFLLLTFYINGASFLAFAVLAEQNGMQTQVRGEKSLYFTAGIMEGGETIGFLTLMCLWPAAFPALAWTFGTLTLITTGARVLLARRVFRA